MTPERLELVAFGPFVEPQVVDLARAGAHGLFLIHGPTGSGKSMLLDALTFALFGETSGSDRDGADLVASLADGVETRVALEFRHAGARYRVERTPRQRRRKKRGDGVTDVPPTAALYRLADGRAPLLVVDGAALVSAAVRDLLRCDPVQFRQTVVLPQGQFRRVIEDDDTRARTLADLFDTQRFVHVQARLKGYATYLRRQVEAALEERATLHERHGVREIEAMDALVATAAAAHVAARRVAVAADARHTAAIEARAEGVAWGQRFEALAQARAALQRLAGEATAIAADRHQLRADQAARDVEPPVRAWRAAEADLEERRQAQAGAAGTAAAAAAAAAAAGRAIADHASGRPLRDVAEARAAQLAPLADDVARLADARARADRSEAAAAAAAAAVAELERRRDAAGAQHGAAEAEADRLEPLAAALPAAQAGAARSQAAVAARDRLAAALRSLADAGAPAAGGDLEGLWPPLTRALAARLEPGSPCPVCGATDHTSPSHAGDRAAALADAHRAIQAAQAAALRRAEDRARIDAHVDYELRAQGWAADTVPDAADLAAADRAARARVAELAQAELDLRAHRAERTAARQLVEALDSELASARPALGDARAAAAGEAATLDALLARLDPTHHDPAAFRAELDDARATVAAYDRIAAASSAEAARAEKESAVAEERRAQAEAESTAAQVRADRHRTEAEAALREAGFRTSDGRADAAAQAAALLEPGARAAAEGRVRAHDEAVANQTAQHDALAAATAGRTPPDLGALDAAVAAARDERDTAGAGRDAARDALAALTADRDRWVALDAELGATEARQRTAQQLADLANGTAKGQVKVDLETYVLRRILVGVLQHANAHLARMTGGRYQLRLRDRSDDLRARGLELDVEDRHAGGARRRVATLSGGEGFQASLALALGLSEAAERTSGAVELGALFIDEGFGSLDSHALDGVVRILRELPTTQRRMVGVITHVDELKRRIEAQLLVTRDGVGSRVDLAG